MAQSIRPAARGAAALALPGLLFSGCMSSCLFGCLFGGGDSRQGVKVKPELHRAEAGKPAPKTSPAAPGRADPGRADPGGADPAWTSALAITAFQVPIKRISLHDASFSRAADLYACAASTAECMVEAAGRAFQDELDADPVTVPMGEYRYVFVKTCEDEEGSYSAAITATAVIAGTTWHTHPTAILDSVGPERPLFVRTQGCGRTYALPTPLRITDSLGSQVSFRLYFDLEELAYAALGSRATSGAWTPDNCAGDRPAESDAPSPPFLCIGYPELSGIIDTVPVALERYRINGGATLGLFFTGGADRPVGGYLRRYYREGATLDPGFEAVLPIRELAKNSDGTLALAAFGRGPQGLTGSDFQVEEFRRTGHSGEWMALPDSGAPMTGSYTAERLTP